MSFLVPHQAAPAPPPPPPSPPILANAATQATGSAAERAAAAAAGQGFSDTVKSSSEGAGKDFTSTPGGKALLGQ